MPRKFSTLILPTTIPQEDTLRQLLLYFETVFLYAPMENTPPALSPEFDNLCQHYAPAPLGDSLTNFQELIRDMTSHRAEYYGGGLSRMSAKANAIDEESVWRLIGRLTPQASRRPQDETLVQARLLLKLAESHDQEEKEIKASLARIERQSQAMLHGLTATDDDELAELPGLLRHDREPTTDSLDRRLWAWSHLFLNDPRMTEHWLITTTPEVMAILAEHAMPHLGEPPIRLLSLPLPKGAASATLAPSVFIDELASWRKEAADCLSALSSSLHASAASGKPETSESIQAQILSCYNRVKAWGGKRRGSLDFYLLPLSLPNLFAKIAKAHPPQHPGGQPLPYGIAAVLHSETDQNASTY